jgi:type I restriction enzyme S subunit
VDSGGSPRSQLSTLNSQLIPPGYKQTEVGVIPEEWEVKSLGELATVTAGGTPSRTNPRYWGGDIPWVTTSEVDFCTITQAEQFITKEGLNNSPAKLLPRGTLLMALYGQGKTRGKVGILGIEAATNQACAAISLRSSVSREFVFHLLASQYDAIRNLSNTGNQENLNSSLVRSISILLPPPPEQRAIAEALSDVDGLLGGLDRLIAKKRDLKQAAMQQLLTGQTRLPGFHGEWPVKTFGELFSFSGGYSASRDQLSSEGHCYLHYGDIHGATKTTVDVQADYQNIPKLDIPLKRVASKSLLEDGDVVFVDASEDDEGTSRHVVVVNKEKKPFISGLHTIVAKSKTDELAHEYRRYCFQTAAIRQQFLFYAVGTKVSGISKTNIAKLTMPVPKVPEQTAIAEVLTEMDLELAGLEQRREKTRALKQAMMQELLTGKTRLVESGQLKVDSERRRRT